MGGAFTKLAYISHRHYVGSMYYHEEKEMFTGTIQLLPITIPFFGKSHNEAVLDFKGKVDAYLKTLRIDPNRRISI